MKKTMKHSLMVMTIFLSGSLVAQKNTCVDQVIRLEDKIYSKTSKNLENTVHFSYTVQTCDWEGKWVNSNVKLYRHNKDLHFFSDQANMYQDKDNTILVLKPQKLVVLNDTPKNLPTNQTDEFLKLRKEFLRSCEVVRCEASQKDKNVMELELKATSDLNGKLQIARMTYTYNPTTEKLLSTTIHYNKGYKVKTMKTNYHTLDYASNYKYSKMAKKYVLDRNNQLLSAYKGYELIDNTQEN